MLSPRNFLGDWRIERRIEDRQAPQTGRFAGLAQFHADGAHLRYREEGRLALGDGPELAASRDYLWRWNDAGVDVRFADGRAFHRFAPDRLAEGTDHPCGADLYRVVYDFRGWPAWCVEWTVTGPRKDWRSLTTYGRG